MTYTNKTINNRIKIFSYNSLVYSLIKVINFLDLKLFISSISQHTYLQVLVNVIAGCDSRTTRGRLLEPFSGPVFPEVGYVDPWNHVKDLQKRVINSRFLHLIKLIRWYSKSAAKRDRSWSNICTTT